MSTLQELEAAIAKLPEAEVQALMEWLVERRSKRNEAPPRVEEWLTQAKGAAVGGVTTDEILNLTRGES